MILFKKHPVLWLYYFVIILISVGLYYGYGFKHHEKVIVFTLFFSSAYLFFFRVFKQRNISLDFFDHFFSNQKNILERLLLFFPVAFILFHFIYLGKVPVIAAFKSMDYYGIAFLRQSIFQGSNIFVNYISSMMLKGILPFSLLYFFICNKRYFWIALPFSVFYAIALMQKSLIVNVILPLVVFLLLNKKYLLAVLTTSVSVVGVFILVYATNPNLRIGWFSDELPIYDNTAHLSGDISSGEGVAIATGAVYERVLFTTGKVAGHWFDKIPSKYPYAKGCAYHFLAPLLGCNFNEYDFSRIIYNDVYKKETKIGLKGTVTVANFVYDYANFGYIGLIYSGIILALFFVFLQKIFDNNYVLILSLNALFIFWLSSSAFHTLLLSGGWALTIILFLVFKTQIKQSFNVLASKN